MNMVLARYSKQTIRTKLTIHGQTAETWRTLRKTAHAILTPQAVNEHLPIQKAEAIQLLYDFLTNPKV